MGTYINRGNSEFRDIVAHEYVDKSSLIPLVNATLNSENRYSCVTRCRRFGKSMAALGFLKSEKIGKYHNDSIEVWDIVPRNVLKDKYGDIFVVDAEIRKI